MATSMITNTIKDASGVAVSGVTVVARLKPGPAFRTSDSSEIAGQVTTTTNGSGAWTLALEQQANIVPAGSWWEIEEQIPDSLGGRKVWAISVGNANATVLASQVSPPPTGAPLFLTQTAGDGRYVVKNTVVWNVKDFGAVGDGTTDDTVAIQAAIDALPLTGGAVEFPPGDYRYTNLATNKNGVTLIGTPGAVLTKTSAAGNGITLAGSGSSDVAALNHPRILNLRLGVSVAQNSGTFLVKMDHCFHAEIAGVYMYGGDGGISISTCFNTKVHDITIRGFAGYAITTLAPTEQWKCIDTYLSDIQIEGTPGNTSQVGLAIRSGTSGVYAQNVAVAQGQNGVHVWNDVPAMGEPQYLFFNSVLADQSYGTGWLLDAGQSIEMDNCWGCSSNQDVGVNINGAHVVRIIGGRFDANAKHGILINQDLSDSAVIGALCASNSQMTANTYDGIHAVAGVSAFQISNVRCANFAGAGGLGSGTQRYGIAVETGASDYYTIVNNLVSGNGTGGVSDGGSGTHKTVSGNIS